MTYRLEPLGAHDLHGFRCGVTELDDWLIKHAHRATGQGVRTYVLIADHDVVVGYFAITPHLLQREEAPTRIGRGASQRIPAILVAKLALAESHHGTGLGAELLVQALRTIVEAARRAGGRLILVDALDESAYRFYAHHDFLPLPNNERRLVMKLSTAAKALGLDWP